ncbi:hypothetical protein GUJ93_ZPchr0012g19300 [Zizania palustris]|uniref:Uncharacterized protein n=1 Tax=Zizania palustris TaxID=103762 RepID=A0A8J6BQ59_ZIZPA|nr:hypothetical protein GUJ93_ZPchr0012g19300 [Zizania palustris]
MRALPGVLFKPQPEPRPTPTLNRLEDEQSTRISLFSAHPLIHLRPPLTVAPDHLRPCLRHQRDRENDPDLGHPSADVEPRRIVVAAKDPNASTAYARRRPRSVDPGPPQRHGCECMHGGFRAQARALMPVYQVHSYCRHYEGFVRELRMMLTFLGFLFEPEFQGVYPDEFAGPCDVSLTVHGSGEHLPPYTTALGGPTFDVACQRVALQALMELRMIYDDLAAMERLL